jgi:tetratricopeptide (TPR) repeat protein
LLWGRAAIRFSVAVAVPILIVLLTHRGQPIQARADLNFFQGMSPLGTGTASARLGHGWEELTARSDYGSAAFDEIRRMPVQFARLIVSKMTWITQNVEIRDSHSFYFFRSQSFLLKVAIPFGVLFGLAVAGLFVSFDRPLFALIALFALTLVVFMVGYRYRMPMVPFLALFAGVALTRIRSPRAAAIALAVCALSFVRPHPASHNLAEEWDFDAASRLVEGDSEGARRSYERALGEDPQYVRAIGGLARVAIDQHRFDDASRYVDRALSLDSRYADGHYTAGLLAQIRNDAPGAVREYGAVVALQPDRVEALRRYAEALAATGDLAKARAQYERVVALVERGAVAIPDGDLAGIHLRIAELFAASGRFDDAIVAARKGIGVDASNPQAWMLLCMVAIDAQRFDVARDAYEHARVIADPRDPNLLAAARRIESRAQ